MIFCQKHYVKANDFFGGKISQNDNHVHTCILSQNFKKNHDFFP
jgi:hypothetical protein